MDSMIGANGNERWKVRGETVVGYSHRDDDDTHDIALQQL